MTTIRGIARGITRAITKGRNCQHPSNQLRLERFPNSFGRDPLRDVTIVVLVHRKSKFTFYSGDPCIDDSQTRTGISHAWPISTRSHTQGFA